MFHLIRDWRYRAKARHLLRSIGTDEANQILESSDHFDTFCEGLVSLPGARTAVSAVGDGSPILDKISALFKWAWDHREEVIKFVLEIISLFPKAPAVVAACLWILVGLLSLPLSSVFA